MLACYTQILHLNSDSLVIEPLPNMKVIKDLVVDIQPFLDNYNKIKPVLIKSEDALKQSEEFSQSTAELKKFWDLRLDV